MSELTAIQKEAVAIRRAEIEAASASSDALCACGEPKDEHYDEVDPPPFLGYGIDAADVCRNRTICGCEGFELARGSV